MSVLYGVGVGPGDSELLTIKAIKIINECEVIVVPSKVVKDSVAFKIIREAVTNINDKELLGINMPMTTEEEQLKKAHAIGAELIVSRLKEGKKVAFITLGDPSIYSTFTYLQKIVESQGFSTEIINGITSFLAAASLINTKLAISNEMLHIIPGTHEIAEAVNMSGTRVIMKAGNKLKDIKEQLQGKEASVWFVENCGMENERIIKNIEEIPDKAGYYSMMIIMEKQKNQ